MGGEVLPRVDRAGEGASLLTNLLLDADTVEPRRPGGIRVVDGHQASGAFYGGMARPVRLVRKRAGVFHVVGDARLSRESDTAGGFAITDAGDRWRRQHSQPARRARD